MPTGIKKGAKQSGGAVTRRAKHQASCDCGWLGKPGGILALTRQYHDSTHAIDRLSRLDISQSNALADKAYGAKTFRSFITQRGGAYTIPPQDNVKEPWGYDAWIYTERHLVECFFQKIKWFRRVKTRYNKDDSSFLAFVYLAAVMILFK